MKITGVSTLVVGAGRRNWVLVRIETDVPGLVGWGEATVESHTRGVVAAVDDLAPLLVGEDPTRIEHLWQVTTRQPYFTPGIVSMSALSGIDQALWDIAGKDLGVPVWRLLGGRVRDAVRLYDHLGAGRSEIVYGEADPAVFADAARQSIADGFDAVKLLAVPRSAALPSSADLRRTDAIMAQVREVVGADVDLLVDFHGRCTPDAAIAFGRVLADHDVYFIEEPVRPEHTAGLVQVAQALPDVPIAAGERLLSRHQFLPLLAAGALAVAQPDVAHAGGISELRRIAALCETHSVAMAPHNPLGPVATAANLQLATAVPNFLIQEVMRGDVPWRHEVVTGLPAIEGGRAEVPTGVGLGVDVDEAAAARHSPTDETHYRWFHEDGSVADW